MTYTYKLARRLARLRHGPAVLLPLLVACAAGEPSGPNSDPLTTDTGADGAVALSPRVVVLEGSQGVLFRAFESLIPGSNQVTSIEWTASGGAIDASGSYASTSIGAFKVVGRRKGNPHNPPDTSTVIVTPPQPTVVALDLTPSTATVGGGLQQPFAVVGILSDGSRVTVGVTWTATGGTIDAGGLFTAPRTAGTYKVIAKHVTTNIADTAVVTVPTATLTSITLSPSSVSLSAGQGQQFSVVGQLSDGSTVSVPVAYTATGGIMSATGYYTAGSTGGTFRVTAKAQSGPADSSTVSIAGSATPPPPPSGGLWRTEDFSTYGGNTATWKSDPHAWMVGEGDGTWFHQEQIHIDTQELYNGHPTLRYDWPGPGVRTITSGADAGKDYWAGCSTDPAIVADYKAPTGREVWIEVAHKFRSDFNNKPAGCGVSAYKFLLIWRPVGDRFDLVNNTILNTWGSDHPQMPPQSQVTSSDGNITYCADPNGEPRAGTARSGMAPTSRRCCPMFRADSGMGSGTSTGSTSPTRRATRRTDGAYVMWIDGKKVKEVRGINTTNTSTGKWSSTISEIFLGSNSNSGTATATASWWGHLKI